MTPDAHLPDRSLRPRRTLRRADAARHFTVALAAAAIAAFVVASGLTLASLLHSAQRDQEVKLATVAADTERLVYLKDAEANALIEAAVTAAFVFLRDPSLRPAFDQARQALDAALSELLALAPDEESRRRVEALMLSHGEVAATYESVFEPPDAEPLQPGTGALMDARSGAEAFVASLQNEVRGIRERMGSFTGRSEAAVAQSNRATFRTVGVWTLVLVVSGLAAYAGIFLPMRREREHLLESAVDAERRAARLDSLTGALKHGAIEAEMRALVEAGARFGIALSDIDGLKTINDTYGHQLGDAALVRAAAALSAKGAVVGRYGGDEFVSLVLFADRQEMEAYRSEVVADVQSQGLRGPDGGDVPLVISVGVASFPEEATSVEDLVRLADMSMYAWRRDQPTMSEAGGRGEDSVRARIIGEIVPLLTSGESMEKKLELVSHRLSLGGDYDAVNLLFFGTRDCPPVSTTFARAPQPLIDAWNQDQTSHTAHPVTLLLKQSKRPLVINKVAESEALTARQRSLLSEANIASTLMAPLLWRGAVVGALSVASNRESAFAPKDIRLLTGVANQVSAIIETSRLLERLQRSTADLAAAHAETVTMLALTAEAHDPGTGRHLTSVRTTAEALALELGFPEEEASAMGLAAMLHDIGKVRVPREILEKASGLSAEDWVTLKQHTVWGEQLLAGHRGFDMASAVARWHHERWDGAGYPDGLRGTAIPIAVSIAQVADALDALTSDRPYRPGDTLESALTEIRANAGRQFNPAVVDALVRLFESGAMPGLLEAHAAKLAA